MTTGTMMDLLSGFAKIGFFLPHKFYTSIYKSHVLICNLNDWLKKLLPLIVTLVLLFTRGIHRSNIKLLTT